MSCHCMVKIKNTKHRSREHFSTFYLHFIYCQIRESLVHQVETKEDKIQDICAGFIWINVLPKAEKDQLFWKTQKVFVGEMFFPVKSASHTLITAEDDGYFWLLNLHTCMDNLISSDHIQAGL